MSLMVAHIVPTPNLLSLDNQPIRMMLAHIKTADYRNFYQRQGNLLLLDNGLYEAAQVTALDLVNLVKELLRTRPTNAILEVIAPDELFDYRLTTKKTKEFLGALASIRPQYGHRLRVMGVPQGKSPSGWMRSAEELLDLGIDTIGLSKLSCPRSFKEVTGNEDVAINRLAAYTMLKATPAFNGLTIHLLGAGNPHEFRFYKGDAQVRSVDTAMAALYTAEDKPITVDLFPHLGAAEHKTKLDFDKRVSETVLKDNMAKVNQFAKA